MTTPELLHLLTSAANHLSDVAAATAFYAAGDVWEASNTYVARAGHLEDRDSSYIVECGPSSLGGDALARYIATMDPALATLLAQWLAAAGAEASSDTAGDSLTVQAAARVASHILNLREATP